MAIHLLENNMSGTPPASFAHTKTRSVEDRHQLLGHASHDAIKHVDMSAEGVKVVDDLDPVSQIIEIESDSEDELKTPVSQVTEIESDSEDELETPAPTQVNVSPPLSLPTPNPAEISLPLLPDSEISDRQSYLALYSDHQLLKRPAIQQLGKIVQQYSDTCR